MPFVQGQLTGEPTTVSFETECACCAEPFRIDIDDELTYSVFDATEPLVFMPLVNFKQVKAPSIVDVF
jgi:hypothetical protein